METSKKNTLFYLGILMLICVGPIILAYMFVKNPAMLSGMKHKNFGTLVTPQVVLNTKGLVKFNPISNSNALENNNISSQELLKRYWTFVTLSPSTCDKICIRNLHFQLRVRLTQGQHIYHVRVVYIVTDKENLALLKANTKDFSALEYAFIKPSEKEKFIAQFKIKASDDPMQQQRIYLIDPPGHWMMYYDPYKGNKRDFTLPTGMRKDLARLIKANKFSYPNKKKEAEERKQAEMKKQKNMKEKSNAK